MYYGRVANNAEYIMSEGNEKGNLVKEVSEHTKLATRNTFDISRQFPFQRNFLIFLLLRSGFMQQVHISMFRLLQRVLLQRQVLTVL